MTRDQPNQVTARGVGPLLAVVLTAVAVALTGCASLPFLSRQVSLSYGELNERIAKRFPMERNIANLLTVTLMRPRVAPERGTEAQTARLSVTLDIQVKLPSLLNSSQRALWGSMTLSGVPRYEPKSKGVLLVDAKLDRVRVDNMPDALSAALAKAASQLAKEHLDNAPIYTLSDAQIARLGFVSEKSTLAFVLLPERLVVARQ